ncbi:MAG TPA: response regulator [Sedimentisphaerales bacterium]|jgi:two-component system chemotaxis response regulator CheY|nr:response regulator [Sedimentisphaerales bacterium]HNU28946.1 response regulator [Sedimentisphaerales bacterium]
MKCLIVEDDFVSQQLLRAYLKDHADCHVAGNGREAVEAFAAALDAGDPYDLICMDIMMPGASGRDALQDIRRIETEHGIGGLDCVKVIMTTALDDAKNILGSFREGCEAYVVKPIHKDKLFAEIEKLGLLSPSR